MPKQYDLIPEDDEEESSTVSSAHDGALPAPPDMADIHSFEGGLYDAYIRSGATPRSPAPPPVTEAASKEEAHPFAQFSDPHMHSQSTTALPSQMNIAPTLSDTLSLDDMKMKEYSRSNAQLNLKKIGLEMSHEQIEETRLEMAKERQQLEDEKGKVQRLKHALEVELMKLGVSNASIPGNLSLRSQPYSVEEEEDTMALGATPARHRHF
eukprot:306511_1